MSDINHGAIGDNSFEERDKLRKYLANRVRREIPQRWGDSATELAELIDMLGLWTRFDPPPKTPQPRRASLRGCDPMGASSRRKF